MHRIQFKKDCLEKLCGELFYIDFETFSMVITAVVVADAVSARTA